MFWFVGFLKTHAEAKKRSTLEKESLIQHRRRKLTIWENLQVRKLLNLQPNLHRFLILCRQVYVM